MERMQDQTSPNLQGVIYAAVCAGLIGIIYAAVNQQMELLVMLGILPFLVIGFAYTFKSPLFCFLVFFTTNYFIMTFFRYSGMTGLSFIIDILIVLTLIVAMIHSALFHDIPWKRVLNPVTFGTVLWMIYTFLEVLNPNAKTVAWIASRQLIYGCLAVVIMTCVVFTRKKYIYITLGLLSFFTLIAAIKAIMQKHVGFDPVETKWLFEEGGALTHIIWSGIRYFSIFTDASNFGSNMGFATLIYGILPFYTKSPLTKGFYIFVAMLSCYGMFISGTRGAIVVPLAGLAYFCLLGKNFRALSASFVLFVALFAFFAFTTLGESNSYIRRMRTAFNPTEDASFNVRQENQVLIGAYMKGKPFGEGLGLGGVEAQRFGESYISTIPVDSWYIKLWVETGWVGLVLYLAVVLCAILWGSYNIMFRIKDPALRGTMAALASGCFGLLISAYGNSFFGQFPTHFIVFTSLGLMAIAPHIDKEDTNIENTTQEIIK